MRLALLLCALALVLPLPAPAQQPPAFVSPLEPLDTSSPRATYDALLRLGAELDAAFTAYRAGPSFAGQRAIRGVLARADGLFDLSATPPASRSEVGSASFGYLKDILMRMPPVDPATLPADPATAPARTRLPGTEIAIVRIAEGPDAGAFLFSADTVARLPDFHRRMIDLPILQPGPYDSWREEQVRFTGPFVPGALVRAMPEALEVPLLDTPLWKVVATGLVFGLAAWLAGRWGGFRRRRAAAARAIPAQLWHLTMPAVVAALVLAARGYAVGQIGLSGRFFQITQIGALVVVIVAAAWMLRSVVVVLAEIAVVSPGFRKEGYDGHLVRMVARVLGLVAAAAVIVYGANELGVPLLGLVAGVGVGGLALALAAQSTVENIFGGVSIFADRPFRVGDFIIFAGGAGYVESIGPRSTRIRADDGMEITVPNADLAKMQVTNKTRRDATLFEHVISFTYDATPAQLADFAQRTLAAIETYPVDHEAPVPPRVRLVGLGDSSIDVQVHAELRARNEDDFYRLQELLLLEAMAIAADVGLALAFPTRTLLLDRQPREAARPAS